MLEPEDLVQINMKMPIFSPDRKVWRTSLLEKLLVTGTIGVNPDLVEREYNFPRFKLLCPENETETELIERVKKSGKELLNVLESESIFGAHKVDETISNRKNSCCFPTKKHVNIDKEGKYIGVEYNETQKETKSEELDSGVYDPHFSNSKEGGVYPDTQLGPVESK